MDAITMTIIDRMTFYTNNFLGGEAMLDFNTYVIRHGEFGAQNLLEMIERREGIVHRAEIPVPLEERWNVVMRPDAVAA